MLIACRNADNLTQKQLSELTGIDQADISKIENGNANPSIKTLTRIASAMNMNDRFTNTRKKIMTHKATRVIMGVTTQPQTGGAICVITLILPQKSEKCQEF